MQYAKMRRKYLSKGERSYYKMGYVVVKPVKSRIFPIRF